jgi:GTPase KRas protein
MLEVLDTAGQEEYTALRDQWIRDGEGFVLVYSISSRSSFTRITRFHNQIQRVKESTAATAAYPGSPMSAAASTSPSAPVPIMLVGNKSDRVTEREVSTQEGHALARELGCEFVEASAKNCINVEKAFYDVVRQLRRQRLQNSIRVQAGNGKGQRIGSGDGLAVRDPSRTYRTKKEKGSRCPFL